MGFLFFLSIPVFYFIGLVSFILWIANHFKTKNKIKNREEVLEDVIEELEKASNNSPDRNIAHQLKIYKEEYGKLQKATYVLEEEDEEAKENLSSGNKHSTTSTSILEDLENNFSGHSTQIPVPSDPKEILTDDINKIWERWYSNNSINLLLYIGAFLIVASASIFVGFQWETISGTLKALLITLLTLAFFGFGIWFYQSPKVKNAGLTFCTIGALLIPLTGLAWYNFVFKDIIGSLRWVWLITSLIGLSSYFGLAFFLKQKLYVYTLSLGTLSLNWSLVNIFSLDSQFYILGAIFSAFVLLFFKQLAGNQNPETKELFEQPLNYSSNVLMPTALGYGLLYAAGNNRLFTFESGLAAMLGSSYYLIYYYYIKSPIYLLITALLFPLAIILSLNWKLVPGFQISIVLDFISLVYIVFLIIFIKRKLREETDIFSVLPQIIAMITFLFGVTRQYSHQILLILSILPAITSFAIAYLRRWADVLLLTTVMSSIAIYYLMQLLISLNSQGYLLSAVYFTLGIGSYLLMSKFKDRIKLFKVITLSTIYLMGLSYYFALSYQSFFIFINMALALVLFSAFFEYKITGLIYPANLFLGISLYQYFDFFLKTSKFQPVLGIIYLGIGVTYYIISNCKIAQKYLSALILSSIAFSAISYPYVVSSQIASIVTNFSFFGLLSHASFRFKKWEIIYLANLFLGIALYQSIDYLIDLSNYNFILGFAYLIVGLIYYALAIFQKDNKNIFIHLIFSTVIFILISLICVWDFLIPLILVNLVIVILLYISSYKFKEPDLIYFGSLAKFFLVINILNFFKVPLTYYPIFQSVVYLGEYFVGLNLSFFYSYRIQHSALATAFITPIIYWFVSAGTFSDQLNIQKFSLISAYFSSALWIYHASLIKKQFFVYFSSAVVFITYLWQISYLNISELLVYTISIGLYFIGIGYSRKIFKDFESQQIYEYLGLAFFLFPTFIKSFGFLKYALILGIEGIALLILGISLKSSKFNYFAVAAILLAVITQTYEYVFSLPRWIITGVAGLTFLSTAVYLLWHRKENIEEKSK